MTASGKGKQPLHHPRSLRVILLICLAAVPVVQCCIIAVATADHQICFGNAGGWRGSRDLLYLAPAALRYLADWNSLLYLPLCAVPVIPAFLYVIFRSHHSPRVFTAHVTCYLLLTTIPLLNSSTWHDCDRKVLDLFDLLPPVLSSLATAGFLLLALITSATKNASKKSA